MLHDRARIAWTPALALLLAGCWGRGIGYEGGTPQDTSPPESSECGEDLDLTAGINITGTAVDLQTGQPITLDDTGGTALCAAAIDPAPAVTGGDPEYLIVSTLCEDGTYILAGMKEVPTIGVMVGIYDCSDGGTVMRTVTGIATESFDGMGAGDTLEGVTAWSVSADHAATMQKDLGGASAFDLREAGFLGGFVTDSAGAPVGGATVTCGSCGDTPTYYLDDSPEDGLWGDGSSFNTTTKAAAGSMFMIPGARITTYTCDDGGAHNWDGELFGSLPEYAVFIEFDAL